MNKLFLLLLIAFVSCSKSEQFKTTVKATPSNVAFSLNSALPYHVTVQTETMSKKGQFVFSANEKLIFDTFADAVKDTSIVSVVIESGEIIEAEKVKK